MTPPSPSPKKAVKGDVQRRAPSEQRSSPVPATQMDPAFEAEAASHSMYMMLVKMLILVGVDLLVRKFNLTDSKYNLAVRIAFATAQAIVVGTLFLVRVRINNRPDKAVLEFSEPSPPFSGQPSKRRRLTVQEYDLETIGRQLREAVNQVLFAVAINYFFKNSRILIISSVTPLHALLTSPLIRIHLFGRSAKGLLQRPFRDPPSPFAELMKQMTGAGDQPTAQRKKEKDSDDDDNDNGNDEGEGEGEGEGGAATVPPLEKSKVVELSESSGDEHPLLEGKKSPVRLSSPSALRNRN